MCFGIAWGTEFGSIVRNLDRHTCFTTDMNRFRHSFQNRFPLTSDMRRIHAVMFSNRPGKRYDLVSASKTNRWIDETCGHSEYPCLHRFSQQLLHLLQG